MSAKHTPGPWGISDSGRGIKQDMTAIGLSVEAGVMVAYAYGGSRSGPYFVENDEEVAANACLIAAAPDLLKACQRAIYALKGREHDGFLRDAISKATGDKA